MADYVIDNSKLQARSPGLGYRFSKRLEDKDKVTLARWGSTIQGVDEGDGWLKVEHEKGLRYLPFEANGVTVLALKEPAAAPAAPAAAAAPAAPAQVSTPKKPAVAKQPASASPAAALSSPGGSGVAASPTGGAAGYIFMCGAEMQQECASLCVVGAAQFELAKMKRHITADTQIFLFNPEGLTLTGAFSAAGEAERDLVQGAFGGKCSAQLRVAPLEAPLRCAKLERRLVAGPKSAAEVEALRAQLAAGEELDSDMQAAWSAASASAEPPAKKMRVDSPVAVAAVTAAAGSNGASPGSLLARKAKSSPAVPSSPLGAAVVPPKAKSSPAVASNAPKAAPKAVVPPQANGANGAVAAGYVFVCNKTTLPECQANCLMGSPQWELPKMKCAIAPSTQIFLYNFDSQMLLGPFKPLGMPDKDLQPGAFNGRFSAQVKVAPLEDELRGVKMPSRVAAGAKSADEVAGFTALLQQAEPVSAEEQEAWKGAKSGEPAAKRARTEPPKAFGVKAPGASAPAAKGFIVKAPVAKEAAAKAPVAKAPVAKGTIAPKAPVAAAQVPTPKVPIRPLTPTGTIRPLAKAPLEAAKAAAGQLPKAVALMGKGTCIRPITPGGKGGVAPVVAQAKPAQSMPGYLFMCGKSTYWECESNRIFGSPMKELGQMKRFIQPTTKLFIFNFDSMQLLGPFLAQDEPQKDVVPGAFGGKFQAHVRVAPMEAPLREATAERRLPAGPKSAAEVAGLLAMLKNGKAANAKAQDAWGPPAEEPPAEAGAEEPSDAAPQAPPAAAPAARPAAKAAAAAPAAAAAAAAAPAAGERSLKLGAGLLGALSAEATSDMEADLTTLAETFGVVAELDDTAGAERVVLRGDAASMGKAMQELQGVLQFYGVAAEPSAATQS